ncbi:MAG: heparan-alpha-glucosaminide N-acetyltransferase domain-containing protein, partial [Cytophagales bacterium]|nr:heparan-alpha-glucosaminide N-acetyltransferase domain-containing protein [Cytophagales bacterium]
MQNSLSISSQTGPNRISVIDSLRGFALMGLFIVHCSEYFELYWLDPAPSQVHDVVFFLFAGKAYAIFALLFGLNFHIMMHSQATQGHDFSLRYFWRLIVLFAIGYVHCLIYSGDILQVISVLGLSLLVVHRFNNWWIFGFSIAFLINLPLIYHFYAAIGNIPGANDLPIHWALSGQLFPVLASGTLWETIISNGTVGFMSKWYFYYESGRVFHLFGLFMWGLLLG